MSGKDLNVLLWFITCMKFNRFSRKQPHIATLLYLTNILCMKFNRFNRKQPHIGTLLYLTNRISVSHRPFSTTAGRVALAAALPCRGSGSTPCSSLCCNKYEARFGWQTLGRSKKETLVDCITKLCRLNQRTDSDKRQFWIELWPCIRTSTSVLIPARSPIYWKSFRWKFNYFKRN